jgi:hypothetical protein
MKTTATTVAMTADQDQAFIDLAGRPSAERLNRVEQELKELREAVGDCGVMIGEHLEGRGMSLAECTPLFDICNGLERYVRFAAAKIIVHLDA